MGAASAFSEIVIAAAACGHEGAMRTQVAVLVLVVVGCHTPPAGGPDASGPPDAMPDAAPDVTPDSTPDSTPDAAPDAMPAAIAIDSVATTDGFTQLRQDSSSSIVIRGHGFTGATSITLGDLAVHPHSISDVEIDADVSAAPGHAAGPVDLAITAPAGTATRAAALTVTFVIVSPTGTAGAHGTYQQPTTLCDPDLQLIGGRDTIDLLAGDHVCGTTFSANAINLVGAGSDATVVHTPVEIWATALDSGPPLEIRGVRLAVPGTALVLVDGRYTSSDLVIDGAAIGIDLRAEAQGSVPPLAIDGFTYRGPGTAVTLLDGSVSIDHGSITASASSAASCLSVGPGSLSLHETTIEGCAIGVDAVGGGIDIMPLGQVTLDHCALWDDDVGIYLRHPQTVTLTDTTIRDREGTPLPATTGVLIRDHGALWMTRGDILGYQQGVEGTSGHGDYVPDAVLDSVTIDAAQTGVRISSASDPLDSSLTIRRSTIHAGTGDAVYLGGDSHGDLGTAGQPGGNTFESAGGYALDVDVSDQPYEVDAHGCVLNGTSYDGQTLMGPATHGHDVRVGAGTTLVF
jgi:hypothetical protein